VQTLDAHTRTVRMMSWHPSGFLFASASFDGTIGIWRWRENEFEFECIDILEGHDNEIKCVQWDSSGKLLASCSRDKSVWIWELDENDENNEFEVVAVKRSHGADVKCLRWSPFEQILVSCSYDDTIKTYKCDQLEDDWFVDQILKKHSSTVWSLSFNPFNGDQFVSCSDDQSVAIWQKMENEQNAFRLKQCIDDVHDEAIYCVDWLCSEQDGVNVIATCSGDNSFKILQQNQSNKEWQVSLSQNDAHKNDVNWIEFGPRKKAGIYLIATASDDHTVKIWQFRTETKPNHEETDNDAQKQYDDIVNEID